MKQLKRAVLTSSLFLLLSPSIFPTILDSRTQKEALKIREEAFDWETHYEKTIQFIKSHEGFSNGERYIDLGGTATVGYGHVILPTDSFSFPLSEEQADSLLRADFEKALRGAERISGHLKANKKLAIAHFIYSRGIGNYIRSDLRKLVDAGEPIDEEIVKWSYYRNRSGKLVRSRRALQTRKWELDLYNGVQKITAGYH